MIAHNDADLEPGGVRRQSASSGGARNFEVGAIARGLGDGSPPLGSRGKAPVRGLGVFVPQ